MRDHPNGDDGFTLLETLTAAAVFAVLVSLTLGIVLDLTGTVSASTRRVVAANLATKQLESARSLQAVQIPNGALTRTETVDGTTYTITQTANYLPADSSTTVCRATGGRLTSKLVTVTVTWPGMGAIPPVRQDTLRAIGVGQGLDPAKGTVAIAVTGADGAPVAGVVVSVDAGPAVTTGDDGCAVITDLAPGSYVARASTPGFVASTTTQTVTTPALVVAGGQIARAGLLYDRARSIWLDAPARPGYVVPAGVRVVARSTYLPAQALPDCAAVTGQGCASGLPGQALQLFPAAYDVWAGTCADAGAAPARVDLGPAAAEGSRVGVPLAAVDVTVQESGVARAGAVVHAVHDPDPAGLGGGCAAGERYELPATDATGTTRVLLPSGTWRFSLSQTPAAGDPVQTLRADSGAAVPVVVAR